MQQCLKRRQVNKAARASCRARLLTRALPAWPGAANQSCRPCLPITPALGSTWSPEAYAALRDCTVADAAAALARAGRTAALPLLLQRHPHALLPSLLDALACVPETADVKQYAPLLRQVRAAQTAQTASQQRRARPAACAAAQLLLPARTHS